MRIKIFLISFILIFAYRNSFADKIIFKDGQMLKGVVVEDYVDRVNFSTFEGERLIIKTETSRIEYDTPEDNFVMLASQSMDKGYLDKALFYYEKAYMLNPASKAAKDGLVLLKQNIFKKEQLLQEEEIQKRRMIEEFRHAGEREDTSINDKEKILKDSIGIIFKVEHIIPEVINVMRASPAHHAGINVGDKIVAIWSRLTGYLGKDELLSRLIDPAQTELKLTIERRLAVKKKSSPLLWFKNISELIGAKFVIEYDGITVAEVFPDTPAESAGLQKRDLVVEVEGQPTRYMNLKSMEGLIRKSDQTVKFVIRREFTVWRRGG